MDYFKYIERANRPHRQHVRIKRIEKRLERRFSEFEANRELSKMVKK